MASIFNEWSFSRFFVAKAAAAAAGTGEGGETRASAAAAVTFPENGDNGERRERRIETKGMEMAVETWEKTKTHRKPRKKVSKSER